MRVILTTIALMLVALSGCTDAGSGTASVYVKDAPTDEFSEIHLNFTEVRVHYAGDGSDGSDGEWTIIYSDSVGTDVDLLAASGDASAFLGEEELDAGRYTQIVVTAQSAYGIDNDGERVNITVTEEDLKVVGSFEVESGQETRITVDYDLDRSMTQQGLTGEWRLNPVLGGVHYEQTDDDESGEEVHDEGEITNE